MKKLLLVSALVAFGIVCAVLALPIIFHPQITQALKDAANRSVRAEIAFSDADITLWKNFPRITATLEDFSIAGGHEFHGDTLVRSRSLDLVLDTKELLFNDIVKVTHLALDKPDIHIAILPNGLASYDIVRHDEADSTDEFTLDITSWEVNDARFRYEDARSDFHLRTHNVTVHGDLSMKGDSTQFTIAGSTEDFNIRHHQRRYIRDKNVSLELHGTYDTQRNTLTFGKNHIAVNNLDLGLTGSLTFLEEDTEIDLKFHSGEADFADVLSLSQVLFRQFDKLNIEGRMSLDAEFRGILNTDKDVFPAYKANLIVSDGSIRYRELPSSLNQINFDLAAFCLDGKLENTTVTLQYFGMNIGENPIFGSAQIQGFNDGKITADLVANFPLADIAAVYPLEGIAMSGDLGFELKANGRYTGRFSEMFSRADWSTAHIPAFHLGMHLTGGNVKYDGLREAISGVNMDLYADNKSGIFNETSVSIQALRGFLGDNPVAGDIAFEGIDEPVINGEIMASINLADVKDFYPLDDLSLKGHVDLDVKMDGKWSAESRLFPKVHASIDLSHGEIRSTKYPAPMENTHLVMQAINETGRFADTRFLVDTLSYTIEGESFEVRGSVTDLERFNYDLDAKGILYLEKIQKICSLDGIDMRGEVDVDLRTSGNLADLRAGKYHALPTEGHVKLKEVFVRADAMPQPLHVRDGHFFFTNEKIFLDTLHGSFGESQFNVTGHLYNYFAFLLHRDETIRGDLLLESANLDLNELFRRELDHHDTVHHDLELIGVPSNIDFTFDSKIGQVRYKNLVLSNLNGEIAMKNGVLILNKTTFDALDASFALSGDYDPRDISHPRFDLDLGIHDLDINKAHEAFVTVQAIAPAAEDTYGIFSIDYKMKGELTRNMMPVFGSLEGAGTVRVRDAKVNGMKVFSRISGLTKKEELLNPNLKDLVMDIDVADGIVNVKPFTMKLAGFDTEIAGKHELTGSMNYTLRIALPPFDIVKIPLHIDGTYDNPRVHIGKGHEDMLKKTMGFQYPVPTARPLALILLP